ncbi:MAG: hypothetical protein DDG60_07805 [Anaerolineae bacterium]|nr:MAG: hypothetical protein DDG60_07805 [Anaerolineae bacterium]
MSTKPFFLHRPNPSLIRAAALIGLLALAYGLLIPWQGYAFDEWHFIYYSLINGPKGLPELFHYDGHPQSTWIYLLMFRLLGYAPLGWHLFAFFWKTACVLMFWAMLRQVWPEKDQQTFLTALLFGLYPFFTLQIFAIAYFEVWYSFFLLWLSIYLSLRAIRQPAYFWAWTGFALLAKIGHLFTSEYTWFLEIFRPLFLLLVLPADLPRGERVRRTALLWLPYFVLFFTSVIWRGFFYQPLRPSFRVMEGMFDAPHLFVLAALRHWIPDFSLTLFTSWFHILQPEYLDLGRRTNALILFISVLAGALAWLGIKPQAESENQPETAFGWTSSTLAIGLLGMIAGFLPSYIAGYTAYLSEWPSNARLALAAFPGAALILTTLLERIARPRAKVILVAILTGLLIGWHVRVQVDFLRVWEAQKEFYRQLIWRIPALPPDTMLILTGPYHPPLHPDSPARIAAEPDFATSLAINTLYTALPEADGRLPYWFSSHLDAFEPGHRGEQKPLWERSHATLYFKGNPENLIVLQFQPEQRECLRVVGPEYANYKRIPPRVKEAALLSRPENIREEAQTSFWLRDVILGKEENPGWCYYYQKGALAAQFGRWEESLAWWEQAVLARRRPRNGYELLPFIEAQMRMERWQQAADLTRLSAQLTPGMDAALCPLWKQISQTTRSSEQQQEAQTEVYTLLKCIP